MQYFVETDTDGKPINRLFRSLVYQRAKNEIDTTPFGTKSNVYGVGYEWMNHSVYPKDARELELLPRVKVGGKDCKQPYSASILNIAAMSFGALSNNAVMAMNLGAKMGDFAQNTGEGGISSYHKKYGGDLIWQIGTAYFGCRDANGDFSAEKFKEKARDPQVKMVEIKISQGAKPGHGGILPASKNTPEIAEIRGIEPNVDVHSPPGHSAFSNAEGLMEFIKELRELSAGKPIGFKICIGKKEEFIDFCNAMKKTGITPDFISVDGGEGGTGAAPVEFSNSLGMPLRDALSFVSDLLKKHGLRKEIKLIASGKIISSFHIARSIALGADICYSARAMMLSAGCIQALECNRNTCPVGVTTQNKSLVKGLVVEDKSKRVYSYHKDTVKNFMELLGAAGFTKPEQIKRSDINRRVAMDKVLTYEEIYATHDEDMN
ncbi:MAG: FMN-binding glutamate synthase family protein [Chitinophagales bacterium]